MEVNPVFTGRSFSIKKDLCFVLIPLRDPFLSIFEQNIKPVASKCGLTAIKADDIYSNKPIMEDVWAYLNQARIVIADLTNFNPNVFYELGVAHTLGKEVIMVSQYDTKPPFDVGHVRYINYIYPSRIGQFESALEKTIKEVLRGSATAIKSTKQKSEEELEGKKPAASSVRLQRLGALTEWAGEWMNSHYKPLIHLGGYADKEWELYERANSRIREEATKRWGSSSSTAKDYADAVMLTIKPEFQKSIEDEIANEKASRIKDIPSQYGFTPTYTPIGQVWMLWDRYPNDEKENPALNIKAIVEHFAARGRRLTAEQVNKAVQDLLRMGAIYEIEPATFKRVEGWNFHD